MPLSYDDIKEAVHGLQPSQAQEVAAIAQLAALDLVAEPNNQGKSLLGATRDPSTGLTVLDAVSRDVLAVSGAGGALQSQSAFSAAISFTANKLLPTKTVLGALAFTVSSTGAVPGYQTYVPVLADGFNAPTFSGFTESGASMGYSNTEGISNQVSFWYDGTTYFYSVTQAVGAVPSYHPGIVARLTATAGLTESGDASTGWSYTSTVDNLFYGATAAGVSSFKIASGADGYFQYTMGTLTASKGSPFIGLRTTQALGAGYADTYVGIFLDPGSGAYQVTTAATPAAPTVVLTPAAGDILRIERRGSTCYAKIYKSGTGWTTVKTWTGQSTADAYGLLIVADMTVPASNVRGGNIA